MLFLMDLGILENLIWKYTINQSKDTIDIEVGPIIK